MVTDYSLRSNPRIANTFGKTPNVFILIDMNSWNVNTSYRIGSHKRVPGKCPVHSFDPRFTPNSLCQPRHRTSVIFDSFVHQFVAPQSLNSSNGGPHITRDFIPPVRPKLNVVVHKRKPICVYFLNQLLSGRSSSGS